jgi:hypothetical protein
MPPWTNIDHNRFDYEPKNSIDPKTDRSSIHKYHITMGSESRRDTGNEAADDAAKEALNEETHHTET